jgi:ABC-type sugar transport system substrate-binding protein
VSALCALAIGLASCSSGGGGNTGSSSKNGSSGKHYTIGVSFYSNTIPLYIGMQQGMQAEAKKVGATLSFAYANNDASTQTNQIATFVTKHVDLILASPVDAKALVPAYQRARKAGIPVISVANKVADADEDAFVGNDWTALGKQTMEQVIQHLGGKGQIAEILGPPAIDFVRQATAGFQQALDAAPGVKVVDTLTDPDMSTSQALNLANTVLTAHPDVNAVVSSIDDITMGVITALKGHGVAPGKVYLASWDATPARLAALKQGWAGFTVSNCPINWGKVAVDTAVDWLKGQKPSAHSVPVKNIFITDQNVNTTDLTGCQ